MSLLLLAHFNYVTQKGDQQTCFTVECWSIMWYCGRLGCGDNKNTNVSLPSSRFITSHVGDELCGCMCNVQSQQKIHTTRQYKEIFIVFFLIFLSGLGLLWFVQCRLTYWVSEPQVNVPHPPSDFTEQGAKIVGLLQSSPLTAQCCSGLTHVRTDDSHCFIWDTLLIPAGKMWLFTCQPPLRSQHTFGYIKAQELVRI